MRRSVIFVVLAASLLVPAQALAARVEYKGVGRDDPKVKVRFDVSANAKVKDFRIRNYKLRCTNGEHFRLRSGYRFGNMNLSGDGEFERTEKGGGGREHVEGRLRTNGRARGKFEERIRLDSAGDPNPDGNVKCETGVVRWTAEAEALL